MDSYNLLCSLFLVFCITGPLVFNPDLRRDAFHPYSYFVLTGLMIFGIPSVLLAIGDNSDAYMQQFPATVLLTGLAFVAFWWGWRSRFGTWVSQSLPILVFDRAPSGGNSVGLWIVLLAVYASGWFGRLASASTGSSHLPTDLGGLVTVLTWFSYLGSFATYSYALMIYLLLRGNHKVAQRLGKYLAILLLLVLEIIAGGINGGRSSIVLPLLQLIAVFHLAVHPIRWRTLFIAYTIGYLVLAPALTLYRAAYYELLQSGRPPGPDAMMMALEIAASEFDSASYWRTDEMQQLQARQASTFEGSLRVFDYLSSRPDFQWGQTVYSSVVSAVIPRWLWPDKPVYLPGRDFAITFWGMDADQTYGTNMAIGMPAESYYNFGWLGVLVFPFLGIFYRFFQERLATYRQLEHTYVVRVFMVIFVVASLDNTFFGYIVGVPREWFTVMAFLMMVNRQLPRWRSANTARLEEQASPRHLGAAIPI